MNGEKEYQNSLIQFTGEPLSPDKPLESSKWKKFLAFINPFAKEANEIIIEAKGLTRDFYQAEINKKNSEAERFGAEAADKAASAKLKTNENVKIVNDEISRIFSSELPEQAKILQIANLIANNPEINDQLNKIDNLMRVMRAVNFSEFQFEIEKPSLSGLKSYEPIKRVLVKTSIENSEPHRRFECEVYFLSKDEGGRQAPIFEGYRAQFYFRDTDVMGRSQLPSGVERVMPGDNVRLSVELDEQVIMEEGLRFAIREGERAVGAGVVTKFYD